MGDLSKSFNRSEFACLCGCGRVKIDIELIAALEWLDTALVEYLEGREVYIVITSGNRCPVHNFKVGGSRASKHMYSLACDFKVYIKDTREQVHPAIIFAVLDNQFPDKYGIGLYVNRNHLDVRWDRARWEV